MRGVLGDEAPGTPPCSIDPGPRSRAAVHRVQSTADVSATHVSSSAASASVLSPHAQTTSTLAHTSSIYSVVVNNL